jgi:hypothetical protein
MVNGTRDVVDVSGGRGYRRARCAGCGLPVEACICHEYVRLSPTSLRVTVVVAADEATRPSNTTRVLRLWLNDVDVRVRGQRGVPLDTSGFAEPGTFVLFPGPRALPLGVGGPSEKRLTNHEPPSDPMAEALTQMQGQTHSKVT